MSVNVLQFDDLKFASAHLNLDPWINEKTKDLLKNKVNSTIFIDEKTGNIISRSEYIAFVFRQSLVEWLIETQKAAILNVDRFLKYYKAIAWVLNTLVDAGSVQGFLAPPTFINMPVTELCLSNAIYVFPHIKLEFIDKLDEVLGFSTNGLFVPEGLYTEAKTYNWEPLFKAAGLE